MKPKQTANTNGGKFGVGFRFDVRHDGSKPPWTHTILALVSLLSALAMLWNLLRHLFEGG
jgi:hypothetical protein